MSDSMSQHRPNCEAQAAEIDRLREEAAIHADDLEELCWIEIPEEKAALEAAIDFLRQVGGRPRRKGRAMSACYECSLCGQQYSDLNPAMRCCEADKAAMTGISGQALMSLTQAAEEAERERIVAWLRSGRIALSMDGSKEDVAASAIEAKEHLK